MKDFPMVTPMDRRKLMFGLGASALLAATGFAKPSNGGTLPVEPPAVRPRIVANTPDPFATATADEMAWVIGPTWRDHDGDGLMWLGRGVACFTGVSRALVWERDGGRLDLDAKTVLDHFELPRYLALSRAPGLSPETRKSLESFLSCVPGYDETKGTAQHQTTLEQFGWMAMIATGRLRRMIAEDASWADAWAEADPKNRPERGWA